MSKMQIPSVFVEEGAVIERDGKVMFNPEHTYILFGGGRGRGGSWTMIAVAVVMSLQEPMDIMVLRQSKNKIKESVWKLIHSTAQRLGVADKFQVTRTYIATSNGSRFFYEHMANNVHGIRSIENVRLTLGEECQDWDEEPIKALKPTIMRTDGAQFVGCYNPQTDDDPIETQIKADQDCLTVHSTIKQNPFAPYKLLREYVKSLKYDPEGAEHTWHGGYNFKSGEFVFPREKWTTGEAPAVSANIMYGLDYGYGGDPTVLIEAFRHDDTIYITDAEYLYQGDPEKVCEMLDGKRLGRAQIYADIANAGDNRYLMNKGHGIQMFKKDPINTGLYWLRAHKKIVIAPHLDKLIEEFQKYRWVKDKHSGRILGKPIDDYNHGIDALRYAFNYDIKRGI